MDKVRVGLLSSIGDRCHSVTAFLAHSGKAVAAAMAMTAVIAATSQALAGPLLDKSKAGEPIKIGIISGMPWCGLSDKGEPAGFALKISVGTLKEMGITNVEPVLLAEWGGLIPGLMAGQFDAVTCGMYIVKDRCKNVAFSDPMGVFADPFIVPKGNPKNLKNWANARDTGAKMVTTTGFSSIPQAIEHGIKKENIMTVPTRNEVLAAMMAGRADFAPYTYFEGVGMVAQSGGKLELTDIRDQEEWAKNWGATAFRKEDQDFVDAYNAAQKTYLGSDEMLAAVAEDGYTKQVLPDGKVDAKWACENR